MEIENPQWRPLTGEAERRRKHICISQYFFVESSIATVRLVLCITGIAQQEICFECSLSHKVLAFAFYHLHLCFVEYFVSQIFLLHKCSDLL